MAQLPDSDNWQPDVQALWDQGQQQAAIDRLLERINAAQPEIPRVLGLQLVYYIFLLGDLPGAERFLRRLLPVHPDDLEILENLAVVLSRQGKAAEAVPFFQQVVARSPGAANAWDGLTACYARLERYGEARQAGERALALKTEAARPLPDWQPPQGTPQQHLERPGREARQNVIAFSIWGSNPRYLRGALRNALLIPELYPGWCARFYLDDSVPEEFRALLAQLGADCRLMPAGEPLRQKLCWRFQVANDPAVGRFLVRDCDSVVNQREVAAVGEWLASACWFHVMRDWWTHTDPILAGLWGGIAGVLPNLQALLAGYRSAAKETANVDQWFLRDVLWGSLGPLALVHDRCFSSAGSRPWPTPTPAGDRHVGQDEFTARRSEQAHWLAGWLQRFPCLQVAGEGPHPSTALAQPPSGSLQGFRAIDLRQQRCRWISLERDSSASLQLEQVLQAQGFQNLGWSPGVRLQANGAGRERVHAMAVALAHQKALEQHLDDQPLLLLEDDVAIESDAQWRMDVPADADAVWVGISRYGKPLVDPLDGRLSRIERMFSAHAVLYLSKRYKQHVIQCVEQCNACFLPFDIGLAFYQKDFNIYALNHPIFYQVNGNGQHNFESMTRGGLKSSPQNFITGSPKKLKAKALPINQIGYAKSLGPAEIFYDQADAKGRSLIAPYLCQSKAQLAQDLFALTVCGTLESRFFVEFGATDGISLSNTWLLEKQLGWDGILAEPGKIWHDRLKANRSCSIDTRCVARESGLKLKFLEVSGNANAAPELSALETCARNGDWASEIRANHSISYEVETISLNDLLDTYNAPDEIQFLSIDTEGSELAILEGYDFSKRRILSICIEHNYQEPTRSMIKAVLQSNGYSQVLSSVSKWDDWYVFSGY